MTTEKLPCGHEIDEEMLQMAVSLAKVKSHGTDTHLGSITCREEHDETWKPADGRGWANGKTPIRWRLTPIMYGLVIGGVACKWERVVQKKIDASNTTPISSGAQ